MERYSITSADIMEKAILHYGILPFFSGLFEGASIEEFTPPAYWYNPRPHEPLDWKVWEWKGEMARRSKCAYGHFMKGKAMFVRLDVFAHLVNYRRKTCPLTPEEKDILNVISANESLMTTDIRKLCGYSSKSGGKNDIESYDYEDGKLVKRKSLDAIITKLQKAGRIAILDIEYKVDKKGKQYGWGVARYATPESYLPDGFGPVSATAEESRAFVEETIRRFQPQASDKFFDRLFA